jgi:hypothetical protein
VQQIEAAETRLDMRDGHAKTATHECAVQRRHRVPVYEHERLSPAGSHASAQRTPPACVRLCHRRRPAGNVRIRLQVSYAARAAPEPDVNGLELREVEQPRNLHDLLPRRREQERMPAIAQPGQHGHELDQLARGTEHHQNHRRRRRAATPR